MKKLTVLQLFTDPLCLLIFILGFSSGLPLSLTGSTLQLWYTTVGMPVLALGMLNLVGMPYTYKFLWSPLMDRFVPPFLGRRRGWIVITQLGLIITFVAMALTNPAVSPWELSGIALITAFLSASQDIAIDAYRTDVLPPEELGMGNAMYTAGYRIAMLISGGVAVAIAGFYDFKIMYLMMAGLMLLGVIAAVLGPEPKYHQRPPKTLQQAVINPFQQFLTKPYALVILAFIVLYKLGDAFTLSLLSPFLNRQLGFSLQELGFIYKTTGLVSSIIGAFAGGVVLYRLGLFRSLLIFGIIQGSTALYFIILTQTGKNLPLMMSAVFLENLCSGMGTTAFLSFIMTQCDHRYTATQFALLSSLAAMGRVYVGPVAGAVAQHWGWVIFFITGFLVAIPGLLLLWWLKNKVEWTPTASTFK